METALVLDHAHGGHAHGTTRRFVLHFFEMVGVMMLGMMVLGGLFGALHQLILGSDYANAWKDHVVLASLSMAVNMTLPMVLWMHYRGHSWERGGEMAAAMNLPLMPLLVLYAFGLMSTGGVLCSQMMLMLPAMLGAMLYRKEEYSARHRNRWHFRRGFRRFEEAG